MEERGNKTIMCSVLFLDIAEYSKKSVSGQISLKDRFNSYLSAAISSVPITDRIILDTGDGAAINFLGDVEDALKAALSLRESMLNEDPGVDPPLLVRMGINLGPVRLVRDINGQPNIVGDGINVAQRVMGFAEASQILVSRSYYDAVSRLSPQYAGMFHYQGSRTDKHVREHEVYAIGYPGDKTSHAEAAGQASGSHTGVPWRVKLGLDVAAARLGAVAGEFAEKFRQAAPRQRAWYAAVAVIPVLLIGVLMLKPTQNGEVPALPGADQMQAASGAQPAAPAVPSAAPHAAGKAAGGAGPQAAVKPDAKKPAEAKADAKKATSQTGQSAAQPKAAEPADKKPWFETIKDSVEHGTGAYISVACKEGTQMFVDGADKGKVVGKGLTVAVSPGKHTVIVSSVKGVLHTQSVEVASGKTTYIRPNFCD